MATEISNADDVIDSRDLIELIEELEGARGDLEADVENAEEAIEDAKAALLDADPIEQHNGFDPSGELTEALEKARKALADWDADYADELGPLKAFAAEFEDYCPDWNHGVTLIRESYFTEYAEELVKDIGDLPKDIPGYLVIDWDATAENLKVDYTEGDFGGVTYFAR